VGVACSILTVLILQAALTLLGGRRGFLMLPDVLSELTATGGLLTVGIALLLLHVQRLPVANHLPALPVAAALPAARFVL